MSEIYVVPVELVADVANRRVRAIQSVLASRYHECRRAPYSGEVYHELWGHVLVRARSDYIIGMVMGVRAA